MKIKEVCRRTELTERTVRYWASEGLISPATYELNGRTYFDLPIQTHPALWKP